MRAVIYLTVLACLLSAGLATGWVALNYWSPATVGTPAHAGVVSQGRPETCTNLSINVRARQQVEHKLLMAEGHLLRGTFEAQGGLGRVDIFLRIKDPQGLDILASPRAENYDFSFPAQIAGEYTFILDNRYSMYTSKSVGLFYCIDDGTPLSAPAPGR